MLLQGILSSLLEFGSVRWSVNVVVVVGESGHEDVDDGDDEDQGDHHIVGGRRAVMVVLFVIFSTLLALQTTDENQGNANNQVRSERLDFYPFVKFWLEFWNLLMLYVLTALTWFFHRVFVMSNFWT